ncbi:MAG TPA: asparagine synthase (glutamine-hydrolyzing), partial [Labilithrix sp.]|nr:asparagine synthase (glutamine-hydrolyzing) [Labilithrix sp.]
MCGIAGIVTLTDAARAPTREQLLGMAAALRHRGPDQTGAVQLGRAGLAHTRLSIIDLTGGRQPYPNAAETVWLVYNGEVFNYVELREELRARGRTFSSASDTEVVLQAYEEWGEDAFVRFNGQFAIGIWDAPRQKLVLARDRLGVRPLYICEHDGVVAFASEVKAIFAGDPTIVRALDPIGIDETFTFWTAVAPRTVFAGIEELRPGHVRTYARGEMHEHAYWSPAYPRDGAPGFEGSLEDAVDAVREQLTRATGLRMLRADVPVGAYLSGGLDSSLIAALARRATSARFSTFSLRFEAPEYDETSFQRIVARELGTEHHEIVVKGSDIARVFPDVIAHAERPLLRTAAAPLFLLSGLVERAGIKVVLTGEGADEMFAGYDLFREAKVRRFWARHPESAFRPRLLERIYPYLARSPVAQAAMAQKFFGRGLESAAEPGFAHGTRWHTTSALKRLFAGSMRAAIGDHDAAGGLLAGLTDLSRLSPLAQDQLIEIRTLLSGYLLSAQGDRMLMANSVEGRFPFLDAEVVALANRLPPSFMLHVLDEKHVLKRVSEGLVPRAVIARTKQPYRAPDGESFVGDHVPEWVNEVLQERAVAEAGVFEPAAVTQLYAKCQRQVASGTLLSNTDNMALVGVLSTQLLHR